MKNKKIVAIIPARGSSKGVKRKNIKLLVGKPLIVYTIEAGLESKYLDRVIVSTEDKEIAEISSECGADIVERPQKLATDDTISIDVVLHALKYLREKGYRFDIVVLLHPTSPSRTVNDIDKAIELFLENKCESVVSVCEPQQSPYWSFKIKRKYLIPVFGKKCFEMPRQSLPKIYFPNGAIFISTFQILDKYKSFYTNKALPFIMPMERSVDIDEEFDFWLNEQILKKRLTKK